METSTLAGMKRNETNEKPQMKNPRDLPRGESRNNGLPLRQPLINI
jgi:hypothetical protein